MSYAEFWVRYLAAHGDRRSRGLHLIGSSLVLVALAAAIVARDWRWLVAMPIIGYGFAWFGHLLFERNKPETFGHPFWSLYSDFRMLALFLAGKLSGELRRARELKHQV